MGIGFGSIRQGSTRRKHDLSFPSQLIILFQAFEQVVPTERTVIHANIKDGSINVLPPNHPGGLVLNLEDISVNTELVNGSPDVSVGLLAKSLNVLLLDDVAAPPPENLKDRDVDRGFQHWVVSSNSSCPPHILIGSRNVVMHQYCMPVISISLCFTLQK